MATDDILRESAYVFSSVSCWHNEIYEYRIIVIKYSSEEELVEKTKLIDNLSIEKIN